MIDTRSVHSKTHKTSSTDRRFPAIFQEIGIVLFNGDVTFLIGSSSFCAYAVKRWPKVLVGRNAQQSPNYLLLRGNLGRRIDKSSQKCRLFRLVHHGPDRGWLARRRTTFTLQCLAIGTVSSSFPLFVLFFFFFLFVLAVISFHRQM